LSLYALKPKGCRYCCNHTYPRHQMEVNGQLVTPAALNLTKKLKYLVNVGGSRVGLKVLVIKTARQRQEVFCSVGIYLSLN
jgi:hypothetical protein